MNNRISMIPVFAILAIQVSTASGNCPPPCKTADEASAEFVGPPMIIDATVPDVANVGPVFTQFRCLGDQMSIGDPPVCPIDLDGSKETSLVSQPPERKVGVSQKQFARAKALVLSESRDLIPLEIRQQITEMFERTIDAITDLFARLDDLHQASALTAQEDDAASEITVGEEQQSPDTTTVDTEEGEVCMAIPVCEAESPSMCQIQ